MKISEKKDPKETVFSSVEAFQQQDKTWTLPRKEYVYTNAFLGSDLKGTFVLPNTYVGIGLAAFSEMPKLRRWLVEKGSKLKQISSHAFANCQFLREIEIPDSVEIIGSYAFKNCEFLEKLVIPEGIKELGEGFAEGCYQLSSITCGIDTYPLIAKQRSQIAGLREIVIMDKGKIIKRSDLRCHTSLYVESKNYNEDYNDDYDREAAEKDDILPR